MSIFFCSRVRRTVLLGWVGFDIGRVRCGLAGLRSVRLGWVSLDYKLGYVILGKVGLVMLC